MTVELPPLPNADSILCKALFSAADILSLTQAELGLAIGLDRTSIIRIKHKGVLDRESKTGELATYVIRIFSDLYALMGGDRAAMRHWMQSRNNHLKGHPAELILKTYGLVHVMDYLGAMRGKV